jgi:hypothetical protein
MEGRTTGYLVGCAVITTEGLKEGDKLAGGDDGRREGISLSFVDGFSDGDCVGVMVGDVVGEKVGDVVGAMLGAVGCCEGCDVG